ncbi:MAG: hypothetical protein WBW88_18450, partial [Rhodothermales bacterium]
MDTTDQDQEDGILLRPISRSNFLRLGGALIAGGSVLAACSRERSTAGDKTTSGATAGEAGATAATGIGVAEAKRVAADPTQVPPPLKHTSPKTHVVELVCTEVIGEIEDGKYFRYLTFNGQVPA